MYYFCSFFINIVQNIVTYDMFLSFLWINSHKTRSVNTFLLLTSNLVSLSLPPYHCPTSPFPVHQLVRRIFSPNVPLRKNSSLIKPWPPCMSKFVFSRIKVVAGVSHCSPRDPQVRLLQSTECYAK